MTTQTLQHYPASGELPRWLVVGFISGALAVLVFHQAALGLLHGLDLAKAAPYSMQPTAPWGVPQVVSYAFWGGLWGIALAAVLGRLDGPAMIIAATAFGAVLPTLVAWFVVAPLKGQPVAAGGAPAAMAVGPIVNAVWGLGTGLGLVLFGRSQSLQGGL